jgi:hypothetical protein
MTPARFFDLYKRKNEKDRHTWLRTGIIAASIYNYSMCRGQNSKAHSAEDYVPTYLKEEDKNTIPFEKLPIEEQKKILRGWVKKEIEENDNLTPNQRAQLKRGSKTIRTSR